MRVGRSFETCLFIRREWPLTAASLATALQLRATMTTVTLVVVSGSGGCLAPRPLRLLRLLPCADEICTIGDEAAGEGAPATTGGVRVFWQVALRRFVRSREDAQGDLVRAISLLRASETAVASSLLAATEDTLVVLREVLRLFPVHVHSGSSDSGAVGDAAGEDVCTLDCVTLSPAALVLVEAAFAQFSRGGGSGGGSSSGDAGDGGGAAAEAGIEYDGLLSLGVAMKGYAPLSRADLRWVQHSFECTSAGGLSRRGLAGLFVWLAMENAPRGLAALRALWTALPVGDAARVGAAFGSQACDLAPLGEEVSVPAFIARQDAPDRPPLAPAAAALPEPPPLATPGDTAVSAPLLSPLSGGTTGPPAAAAAAAAAAGTAAAVIAASLLSSTPRARFSSLYLSDGCMVAENSPRDKPIEDVSLSATAPGDEFPDARARAEDVPTSRWIDYVCLLSAVAVDSDATDLECVGRPEDVLMRAVCVPVQRWWCVVVHGVTARRAAAHARTHAGYCWTIPAA